jgi:hypothetical protein
MDLFSWQKKTSKSNCSNSCSTHVSFVCGNIILPWVVRLKKIRFVVYNRTVISNFFIYIYCSEHMSFSVFTVIERVENVANFWAYVT